MLTPRRERGASAVVLAASILVLLGFAAIAIDIGAGFNERRQDQTAADAAALGGLLELLITDDANPVQAAVDAAKDYVARNVDGTLDWATCTDDQPLAVLSTSAGLGVVDGSHCISFNDAFSQMRVRVPVQSTDTAFGQVLGVSQLLTSAAAEAGTGVFGGTGSFPVGILGNATAGQETCLKTSPAAGLPSPQNECEGSSTGDFGPFNPYFYTDINPASGPDTSCQSGAAPGALSKVFADGLDHPLGSSPSDPGNRVNGGWCAVIPGPPSPNRVDSGGGSSPADITDGLLLGGSFDGLAYTGRLTRTFAGQSYDTSTSSLVSAPVTLYGRSIDNRPLWTYLRPNADGPGGDCTLAQLAPAIPVDAVAYDAAKAQLAACLSSYSSSTPLFTEDILDTIRLVGVPQFHETAKLPNNACCYDIREFQPVFLQTVYLLKEPPTTCTGLTRVESETCSHQPGQTGSVVTPAPGQRRITSMTGIVLDCSMLPDTPQPICREVDDGGVERSFVFELELTR